MKLDPTIEEALKSIAAGKTVDPKMLGKQLVYMAIALNYANYEIATKQVELMTKMEQHLEKLAACTYYDELYKTQHVRQGYSSYNSRTASSTATKESTPLIKKTA